MLMLPLKNTGSGVCWLRDVRIIIETPATEGNLLLCVEGF
jgi:hypothetical protein